MGRGRVGRIEKWFRAILRVLVDKLSRKDLNMSFCLNILSHFLCCVLWGGRGGLHCVKKEKKKAFYQ